MKKKKKAEPRPMMIATRNPRCPPPLSWAPLLPFSAVASAVVSVLVSVLISVVFLVSFPAPVAAEEIEKFAEIVGFGGVVCLVVVVVVVAVVAVVSVVVAAAVAETKGKRSAPLPAPFPVSP